MQESQVLDEWKRFTHGLATEGTVRPVILDSWTRCLQAGVAAEPARVTLRRVGEDELRQRLEANRELVEITQRHLRVISAFLEPLAHVVYLVDGEGIVLCVRGNDPDSKQEMGLLPGYDWSERTMGTNGAGTALVTGEPVMVITSEHFIRHFHGSICTAAPVHDVNGAVIAAIDVCTARENVTAERLTSVVQLASVIEQELSSVRRRNGLTRRLQDRCGQLEAERTERRELQDQLQQSLKQLRMLSRHIEMVKEEEQTRLAREIHDEMGVLMTGLKLDLAQLRGLLGEADVQTVAASLQSRIDSMDESLDQTITVVQRIASDLRPRVLDDLGLVAAIEWQANVFSSRTGIRCDVIMETDDPRIDSERATALFRICQEALTNVARHAHATCVTIRLGETLDQVLLEIEDDGEGIPPEKLTDRTSLGLLGMRERTELLGGEFHAAGNPGRGTIITVRIPTARAQKGAAAQAL